MTRVLLNGSLASSLVNFRGPLIREMIARGHEVHVSAPDIDPATRTALNELGATVHAVPLQRTGTGIRADLAYLRAMRGLMQAIGPDLVVGYTAKPNIWGSLAARSLGIRSASMVTGLGYAFIETGAWRQKLLGGVSRLLYRAATGANSHVIFQNPDDVRDFRAAGCLADVGKVALVNGSGVDTGEFAPVPLPDQAQFLMIGRLLANKGVREYVAAARSLRASGHRWRFVLAGPIDPGPDSISQIEVDGWIAQGAIEYLGSLRDVRPALAEASVYVLPSYREGTPRSVLEAMAMGRPIVTSDAPGCRETVTDGVNGLLVPVGDADALARAMERLGEDAELRRTMGARSREIAVGKYDAKAVAASVCDILGM